MSDAYPLADVFEPPVTAIAVGRNSHYESLLAIKSQESNILQYTPKDAAERFATPEMFEQWYKKGREIHWLITDDDDVAGIIWYGASNFPLDWNKLSLPEEPTETFAIRIYDGYAGKGLARPFMTQSLVIHAKRAQEFNQPIQCIWLETDIDNAAALAAYSKFGYQEVARNEKRVTMVLSVEIILQIISQ